MADTSGIDRVLAAAVERGEIPGVVAAAGDGGRRRSTRALSGGERSPNRQR